MGGTLCWRTFLDTRGEKYTSVQWVFDIVTLEQSKISKGDDFIVQNNHFRTYFANNK